MENAKAWSQPSAIDYYSKHRHEVSDLYPSERVFLPRVLFPGIKVLDVGCASGGFFNIMRTLEPAIDYTGIDLVKAAVDLTRSIRQGSHGLRESSEVRLFPPGVPNVMGTGGRVLPAYF